MRVQATLRGESADRFEANKEHVARRRDGAEPSNAELLRLMMDQFDPSQV